MNRKRMQNGAIALLLLVAIFTTAIFSAFGAMESKNIIYVAISPTGGGVVEVTIGKTTTEISSSRTFSILPGETIYLHATAKKGYHHDSFVNGIDVSLNENYSYVYYGSEYTEVITSYFHLNHVATPTPTPTPEPTSVPMPIILGDYIAINDDEKTGALNLSGKNYSIVKEGDAWQMVAPQKGMSLTKNENESWFVNMPNGRIYKFGQSANSILLNQRYRDEVVYNSKWSLRLLYEKRMKNNNEEILALSKITYNDPEGNIAMEGVVGNYTVDGYTATVVQTGDNATLSYVGTEKIKWQKPVSGETVSAAGLAINVNNSSYLEFYKSFKGMFLPEDPSAINLFGYFGGFGGSRGAVKIIPIEELIKKRIGKKVAEKVSVIDLGPGSELDNAFSMSNKLGKGHKVVAIEQEFFYIEAQKKALASSPYADDVRFVLGDFTKIDNFVGEIIFSIAPYPTGIEGVVITAGKNVDPNGIIYIATDTGFFADKVAAQKYVDILKKELEKRGLQIKGGEPTIGIVDHAKVTAGENELGIPIKSRYTISDRIYAQIEPIPIVSI